MLDSHRNIVSGAALGAAGVLASFHSSGATAAAPLKLHSSAPPTRTTSWPTRWSWPVRKRGCSSTPVLVRASPVANLLQAGKQLATVYISHRIPINTSESRWFAPPFRELRVGQPAGALTGSW